MKNILCVLMALAVMLSLSACDSGSSAEAAPTDQGQPAETEQAAEYAAEEKSESGDSNEDVEPASTDELSLETLSTYPETDESCFAVNSVEGGVEIAACDSADDVVVIPETINGETVVGIGLSAFYDCTYRAVVLNDSLQYISFAAFIDCNELEYVKFGSGLKKVDETVFGSCPKLKTIQFPDGLETMSGNVIVSCESLGEVYVPASVENIVEGFIDLETCPNAVVVTPSGSAAETVATAMGATVKSD